MRLKNLTRKLLSVLLAFTLVFTLGIPGLAYGDVVQTAAVFTVGSAEVEAGATGVEIPITVENCPPFVALKITLSYDTSALTLTEITTGAVVTGGTLTPNPAGGIIVFDWNEAPFPDGEIFILKFNINSTALSGNYPIEMAIQEGDWSNNNMDDLMPDQINNGIITVTNSTTVGEANYNGRDYQTLEEAIEAAVNDSGGTVKLLADKTISNFNNRIVVPTGANITLDMNGHTITSAIPCSWTAIRSTYVVEVGEDAQLNLVDNSDLKGGQFVHTTGEPGTTFLRNAGTLNMSDVSASNFYYGILDDSANISGFTGIRGTYGTISDCEFLTIYHALIFGKGSVGTVEGCKIENTGTESDGYLANTALLVDKDGTINLLEDCNIKSSAQNTVKIDGRIETIKDCEIKNEGIGKNYSAIYINNYASIGTITSTGISQGDRTKITGTVRCIGGTIDLIEGDGTLFTLPSIAESGSEWHNILVDGPADAIGEIGEITGGTFEKGDCTLFVGTYGKVGTISGGIFNKTESAGSYNVYSQGTIENISGGVFNNTTATYNLGNVGNINLISGGEFNSGEKCALLNYLGTIEAISGGDFTTNGGTCIWNYGDSTIGSITDNPEGNTYPRFQATTKAINNQGTITSLTGGYYKNTTNADWINGLDAIGNIPDGYGFSTVPMKENVMGEAGYYHFGELVDITWKVAGQDDKVDKFVKGDEVYYPYSEPTKEGSPFAGWRDEEGTLYKSNEPLPVAEGNATYTAEFLASAEDYLVSLEAQPVNLYQGQNFTVDVNISSENNDNFYGATVKVDYDQTKVEYLGFTSDISGSLNVKNVTSSGSPYLEIICATASGDGYQMTNHAFDLVTLNFKVKSTIASTDTAVFSIKDQPIVNQSGSPVDIFVGKGEDITVNLEPLTVTFVVDGGSEVPSQNVDYGQTAQRPADPTKTGHGFVGWFADEECTEAFDFNTPITVPTTIYAKWTINEYTLEYSAGANGSIDGDAEQTVMHGNDGTAVEAVADEGYHFVQWSDGSTANPRQDTNVTGNISVTAEFAINTYTVTFKDWNGTVLKTETVNHGSAATAPANPSREGYTFKGWLPATFTNITEDLTVTADYDINQYTITFDSKGGTPVDPITQDYGTAVTAPPAPTKEGYNFMGWEPALPFTMPAENLNLEAQWKLKEYTITFKAGANVSMGQKTAYVQHGLSGLFTDNTFTTSFPEPQPTAAAHYTLDDPVWKPESGPNVPFATIQSTAFTANATYTATASPSQYTLNYDSNRVDIISGITNSKGTYLTDLVFKVKNIPARYVSIVEYKVDEGDWIELTADNGQYTIAGGAITGAITIRVSDIVDGTVDFIAGDAYSALPNGYKLLTFTVTDKLSAGAYEYVGKPMFYSGKYSDIEKNEHVYLYAVPTELTEKQALGNIQIDAAAGLCIELNYNGDVNRQNGITSTDVVITYDIFRGHGNYASNFEILDMQARLEADVNGDKIVDTADAQSIFALWQDL